MTAENITTYQKLLSFLALLLHFQNVLLRCKFQLSFKFVLIPKIKASTDYITSKSKVKKPHAIVMQRKKSFHRNDDQSK